MVNGMERFGLDETDMDMIRRGDMLGPKTGEKVYQALLKLEVTDEMVEVAARAMATYHYCDRFRKPSDDPHVKMNVDRNWSIFEDQAYAAISAAFGIYKK